MLDMYISADSAGLNDPNTAFLTNARTGRLPLIQAGAYAVINVTLLDNDIINDLSNLTQVTLEIKPERTDRTDGIPLQNDPHIYKDVLTSGFNVVTSTQLEDLSASHMQFTLSDADTLLGRWRRVRMIITAVQNGSTTVYADGWVQVQRAASIPYKDSAVQALAAHQAFIEREDGAIYLTTVDTNGDLIRTEISQQDITRPGTQFADAAERNAHVPLSVGALALQQDTSTYYISTALTAGAYIPFLDYNSLANKPVLGTSAALNAGTNIGNVVTVGSGGKIPSSVIPTSITAGSNVTFADAAARLAAVPNAIDELGTQIDTQVQYISTGINAGDWEIYDSDQVNFGQSIEPNTKCVDWMRRGRGIGNAHFIKDGIAYYWGRHENLGHLPFHIVGSYTDALRSPILPRDEKVSAIHMQHHDYGYILTDSGNVYAHTRDAADIGHAAGTDGVSAARYTELMTFDSGAGNIAIKYIDSSNYIEAATDVMCTVFVDVNNDVWIVTDNEGNNTYNVSLPSSGTTAPTKLTFFNANVAKARCTHDAVFVLTSAGDLYGCGDNTTGVLNQGNTTTQVDFVLIDQNVDDFEIVGGGSSGNISLVILRTSGQLVAVGGNQSGWMGIGSTANQSSLEVLNNNIVRVWAAGNGNKALIYENTAGEYYASGDNSNGIFGDGTTTSVTSEIRLTALEAIDAQNEGVKKIVLTAFNNNSPEMIGILCNNGKYFSAGRNDEGQQGHALLSTSAIADERRPEAMAEGEVITDIAPFTASNTTTTGHILLKSNYQNIYATGSDDFGFSGVTNNDRGNRSQFKKINMAL